MTFVVFGLPRSRTAWLARFLTYGDWVCGHDEIRHLRSLGDVKTWFSQPHTGTVETAAAPFWRMVRKYAPDARIVTVRRPVPDVLDSLQRCGLPADERAMRRLDAKLDQIEARLPGVLRVTFDELRTEAGCARVFEHCLPYKHDTAWWQVLERVNVQIDARALMRYVAAFAPALEKVRGQARQVMLSDLSARPVRDPDGVTIQQEPFKNWPDATRLFAEHAVHVGESPDAFFGKNLELIQKLDELGMLQITTARCNGRVFGYLMAVIGPSLEARDRLSAVHTTFFVDPSFRGLGMKLQRASVNALRERGVHEVHFHAGVRGHGPKMGAIFRRLGADDFGQVFRLDLQEA